MINKTFSSLPPGRIDSKTPFSFKLWNNALLEKTCQRLSINTVEEVQIVIRHHSAIVIRHHSQSTLSGFWTTWLPWILASWKCSWSLCRLKLRTGGKDNNGSWCVRLSDFRTRTIFGFLERFEVAALGHPSQKTCKMCDISRSSELSNLIWNFDI